MKSFPAALVLLLVCSPAPGQHEDHHAGHHSVAKEARLLAIDDGAGELTVRLGPLQLPARSDHMKVAQPADQHVSVAFDGWIVAYHPRITDSAGTALPGRVLHHVGFWNEGRSDFLCPNKQEHIFGAGGEMNQWPPLPGLGYPVKKGDRIRVNAMFHNPTDHTFSAAYLEVRVKYHRKGEGQPLRSVYPAWFDVKKCGVSSYGLSPGANHRSARFRLRHSGRLVGVGGHMHDYGTWLSLKDAAGDQELARLNAQLDASGQITSVPIIDFMQRGGLALKAGQEIEVAARYDNPTGKEINNGAMGIVVGYFLPDKDAELAQHSRRGDPTNRRRPLQNR